MKRFTCSQVIATVFVLGWGTCPLTFALERGKQISKREVARLVRTSPPLLNQLKAMNVGEVTIDDDAITLERPEATYVFDLKTLTFEDGVMGGLVSIHDNWSGEKVGEVNIAKVSAPDGNRIDFSVTMSTPNEPNEQRTENGAIIGTAPGQAMVISSVNGENARPSLVNFETPAVVGSETMSVSPVVITTTAMTVADSGGVASVVGWWEWLTCAVGFTTCVTVIVVVVAFVAVTCLAFGWWGCDA